MPSKTTFQPWKPSVIKNILGVIKPSKSHTTANISLLACLKKLSSATLIYLSCAGAYCHGEGAVELQRTNWRQTLNSVNRKSKVWHKDKNKT